MTLIETANAYIKAYLEQDGTNVVIDETIQNLRGAFGYKWLFAEHLRTLIELCEDEGILVDHDED